MKDAISYGIKKLGFKEIRENQRQVIEAYLAGRDVFMVSPTGSGKSLTFHIAPFVYDFIRNGEREEVNSICLVIVPLLSLMRDQVAILQQKGIAAVCLGAQTSPEEMADINESKYNILFATPESILGKYRHIVRDTLKERIDIVFIDESHCVAKWGQSSEMEEAFRAEYGRLSELRSMLRREVPFVALTATATDAVRATIIKDLCMFNCVQLLTVPNKPHTKFSVETADVEDLYSTFSWLIDELKEKEQKTSKVLVFCRKRAHVRDLYELFHEHLGDKSYVRPTRTEPMDDRTRLFAMYHRRTQKEVKETVEKEFCKADGTVRVVFCTIAFGMGVDVKNAQLVIHLGPSSTLDDYLQECGRVGRDTTQMSHAVLLKYKSCTGSKNVSKAMKEYVKNTDECRRVVLMREFSKTPQKGSTGHACCDICAKNCTCKCGCPKPDCNCLNKCSFEEYMSPIAHHLTKTSNEKSKNHVNHISKPVSNETCREVERQLFEYRAQLAGNVPHEKLLTGLDLATGYSRSLIDQIVSSIHTIDSLESLQLQFNFLSIEHAKHTWEIVKETVSLTMDSLTEFNENDEVGILSSDSLSSDEDTCNKEYTTDSDAGTDSDVEYRARRVHLEIECCSEDED